jgi:hypothetical protein
LPAADTYITSSKVPFIANFSSYLFACFFFAFAINTKLRFYEVFLKTYKLKKKSASIDGACPIQRGKGKKWNSLCQALWQKNFHKFILMI